MSDSNRFGQFPASLVLSGQLERSGADRTELLILMAIAAHASPDFTAWPAMETLADAAGVKVRAARIAVRRLEARGVIAVLVGGGRSNTNIYTIRASTDTEAKPGSTEQPGIADNTRSSQTTGFEGENPVAQAPIPGRMETNTRSSKHLNPAAIDDRGTKEQKNKQQQKKPAADGSDLIRALTVAGVSDPKRSELATERARRKAENSAPPVPLPAAPQPAPSPQGDVSEVDTCREKLKALPAEELSRLVDRAMQASPTSRKAWHDRDPADPAEWGTPLVYAVMDQLELLEQQPCKDQSPKPLQQSSPPTQALVPATG